MASRRFWGVVIAMFAAAVLYGAPPDVSFSGRAVTLTGALWYTEHDTVRTTAGRTQIETRYTTADGKPMADLSAEMTGAG